MRNRNPQATGGGAADLCTASRREIAEKQMIAAALLAMAGHLYSNSLLVSCLLSVVPWTMPGVFRGMIVEAKRRELAYQLRDAFYALAVSISTGRPLWEGLRDAGENTGMIYGRESQLACELTRLSIRIRDLREAEGPLLEEFAKRCAIEEMTGFVDVYQTTRITGGDTGKSIMKASMMIIEKITIEREINMLIAQKALEGKILLAAPFIATAALKAFSPDYMEPMYTTIEGRALMLGSLASIGLAGMMLRQLCRIDL